MFYWPTVEQSVNSTPCVIQLSFNHRVEQDAPSLAVSWRVGKRKNTLFLVCWFAGQHTTLVQTEIAQQLLDDFITHRDLKIYKHFVELVDFLKSH